MLNNYLESGQQQHNLGISNAANVSASLDPNRIQIDAVKQLQRGAGILANRETALARLSNDLGLSQEETLAQVSHQMRVQRRADKNITEDQVIRQLQQAANSLSDVSESAELKGIAYKDQLEVDPFGQSQDDSQSYSREEAVRYGVIPTEDMYEDERIRAGEASERPVSGSAGVRDALRALQGARANPSSLDRGVAAVFGGEVMPGSAGLEQRLEDSIQYGPGQRAAEADLAREIAKRDRARSGFGRNETAEANYYRAAAEAEAIARDRFTAGGGGAIADEILARIGRGSAGSVGTAAIRDGVYVDPTTGSPLAMQEPASNVFAGSNTPDTNNQLNAPTRESAIEYVARMQPDFKDGGRVFGDYPQVDITGTTTNFANRVRESGLVDPRAVPQDIRSIDEFQKAVNAISAITGEKGTRMYRRAVVGDVNTKKMTTKNIQVPADQVGPEEVLNKLRYTPAEQQQLAQALYQSQVSANSGINSNRSADYFGRNAQALGPKDHYYNQAPEAVNPREGEATVARIQPGQQIEGQDIKAAFRNLSTPGARQPFIGQVEGEAPRINRFVGAGIGNMPTEEIPAALRQQAIGNEKVKAEKALRKAGKPVSPARVERAAEGMVDEDRLASNTTKAMLTRERAVRDNDKRKKREFNIRTRTGEPPAEPRNPSATGYGDMVSQVTDQARQQSAQMSQDEDLTNMIRRMRGIR